MTDKKENKKSAKSKNESAKSADKKETKVSRNVAKLVDEIAKLKVLELSELVNALQNKLGVTPQVAAVAAPAGQAVDQESEGEQATVAATQTVVLTAGGDNKIAVIKALRVINQNWGLKEAKDMTEQVPTEILKDVKTEEAKEAAEKLKLAGATVELK
jgi:large subunit ribosomal protein L7/L12